MALADRAPSKSQATSALSLREIADSTPAFCGERPKQPKVRKAGPCRSLMTPNVRDFHDSDSLHRVLYCIDKRRDHLLE